jgi:hypothetical protein
VCVFVILYTPEITAGTILTAEIASGAQTPLGAEVSFAGRKALEATHDVYLGFIGGKAAYVGITNSFLRRSSDWYGKYDLKKLTQCKVTKDQARGIEQAIIERNPDFNNVINSIAPNRDWRDEAVNWGENWLKALETSQQ